MKSYKCWSTAVTNTPLPDLIYQPDTDRYIVAWQQGGNVYSRGVLPNGTVAGGATTIANTSQMETNPRLASDASGTLLVWQRQNAGSGYDVYARPLDANGQPTGEVFTIQEAVSNQQSPAIAYSSGNRYQLAWQDDSTGPWDLFTATLDRSYQVTHIEYEYDPLGRMTSADYHGDFNGSYTYAYDAVGNRTSYTTSIEETIVTTYQYDDANQLTESIEVGGDTTTYQWDDAGRLIKEAIIGGNITRVYTYDQRGNLTTATVDGLLTTFVYDGNGHRLRMSVGSEITTYTLDYAAGFRVLFEQGGASSTTKHYLYGLDCIGEQVDVGDAQNSQWRYYHQDGNRLVRQTTNTSAEVTLAWTYSPEGAIVLGEEGPVTHLGCDGNTTYDFSTGLIFKNGNYFDPNTGIWLTMGGLVVWGSWQTGTDGRNRKRQHRKRLLLLLLLFLVIITLAGCGNGTPTTTPIPTATCTSTNTPMPTLPSLFNTPRPTIGPPNTPTPWPTVTQSPSPTQVLNPTPTPIGTQYPQGLTGFKLFNPFGTERFLRVDRFLSPYGNSRPGGNGHYGVDLVTERYARASHEGTGGSRGKYEEFDENNVKMTYFEPSRSGTTVFAPATGRIIKNDSHTIKIESNIVSGLIVELTHVKTGNGVITNGNLQTTYYDETAPLGENFPHLHLTVNYNGQDFDPWPFLPLEYSAGNFYYESETSPGSYYHSGNGNMEDLPKIPGSGAQFP